MKTTPLTTSRSLIAFFVAAAMCFSACNCGVTPIKPAKGDGIFLTDAKKDPKITLDPNNKQHLIVDFGPTLVNQQKPVTKTVIVSNDGIADLKVQTLNKVDPFNSDVFKVPNSVEILQSIGTGGTGSVVVSFAPTAAVDYSSDFTLSTDADDTTGKKLTVTLKGSGVDHGCVLVPETKLDFGNVHTNSSYTRTFSVQNTTPIDWTFTYQGISGADSAYFTTPLAQGAQTIKAHEQLDIQITFTANHSGTANALLQFDSTAGCTAPLELTGVGVDSLLTATPVDFGFVDPGVAWGTVSKQVVITNIGNDPISITAPVDVASGLLCDGPFTGAGAACPATNEFANNDDGTIGDIDNGQIDLDPQATVTLTLYFKPNRIHGTKQNPITGHMQFSTSATDQAYFGFNLTGVGGGPKIQVRPDSLDFGVVGIGAAQNRTLVVTNIGSGSTSDSDADLKITSIDVIPGPNTVEHEFSATPVDPYTISLSATRNEQVTVKFDPAGEGDRTATLKIHSNDPVTPEKVVMVKAHGQQLPPCSFTVTPPSLNFGNVVPGRNRILSFRFTNTNADPSQNCLVSSLDLSPDTANPPFSLVNGPVASQLVPGGGSLTVDVKFSPNVAATQLTGAVSFFTSSAAQPQVTVPLSGGASSGCLLVAPDDLDFGVVETGCASKEKTFSIYNICNSSVTLTSIDLQPDPSGRCPGTSCPFTFSHRPNLPLTLIGTGSPGPGTTTVDFKMKFLPTAVETDSASIAIQTAQLASPYLVTLEGRGDTTAIQTDVYRQDAQPKVDVLLVVDDSGSMQDKQTAIAANFQSFISFAISQQVDYHIGVTTTSTYDSTSFNCSGSGSLAGCGTLMPGIGSGPKVLTNTTPNLVSVFGTNVNVGTSGDATEQGFQGAYEALSPRPANVPSGTYGPGMQTALEAGLVRDEANLAIIAVSDASDQSNNSYAFYKNFFTNIKGSRRANAFTFSAVTSQSAQSPSTTCSYDGTNAVPNPYSQMATDTSGVNQEICTTDWASSLRALGQTAFGYRTRFFLSETPDTGFAVEVSIDGVPLPANNSRGAEQWHYNPDANAIDFQPLAVPEPGSTLTITYHVFCYH